MNYKKYGGAPIIGVQKTVIKAHGSSDAYAIKNAVRQAVDCVTGDVAGEIAKTLGKGEGKDAELAE